MKLDDRNRLPKTLQCTKERHNRVIEFGVIVKDIMSYGNLCSNFVYSFVRRTGNKVAHRLANLSRFFASFRVWLEKIYDVLISVVNFDSS